MRKYLLFITLIFLNLVFYLVAVFYYLADKERAEAENSSGRYIAGVTTILSANKEKVRIGEPIELSLTLKYDREEEIPYDCQGIAVHDNYTVIDPDGIQAPFIGGRRSTALIGMSPHLKPNTTVTLFSGMDLTNLYLIDKVGRYTVAFRGYDMQLGNIDHYPASSNNLVIDVANGEIPPVDRMMRRLLAICPDYWSVGKLKGKDNTVSLMGRQKVMGFGAFFQHKSREEAFFVYQTQRMANKRSSVEDDIGGRYSSRYLGKGRWGHVYIYWGSKTRESWPSFIEDISSVLLT